jgi:hypothetical protein
LVESTEENVMEVYIALGIGVVAVVLAGWWRFGNLSEVLGLSEQKHLKEQSAQLLAKMDQNVAERKSTQAIQKLTTENAHGNIHSLVARRKPSGCARR